MSDVSNRCQSRAVTCREIFVYLGVYELTHNNKTVSLKTINAVQQMSLYPELIASVLYQATGSNVCISFVFYYF